MPPEGWLPPISPLQCDAGAPWRDGAAHLYHIRLFADPVANRAASDSPDHFFSRVLVTLKLLTPVSDFKNNSLWVSKPIFWFLFQWIGNSEAAILHAPLHRVLLKTSQCLFAPVCTAQKSSAFYQMQPS